MASRLPPSLIARLRSVRNAGYWLLEPVDLAARKINRMGHYPPLVLRRHVGFLGGLDGVGKEFTAYLKLLCDLSPSSRMLDLGCGCGLLELALLDEIGPEGLCVGVDIHKPSIDWATRTITRSHSQFVFHHADIHNPWYWPSGRLTASQFFATFQAGPFDIIVAKSLFTHMLPDELAAYLEAISTRMSAGGTALLTFFLLNEEQEELAAKNLNEIPFAEDLADRSFRVRHRNSPSAAVAYREDSLRTLLTRNGLDVVHLYYGRWSGRQHALSYQDILKVRRSGCA